MLHPAIAERLRDHTQHRRETADGPRGVLVATCRPCNSPGAIRRRQAAAARAAKRWQPEELDR